MSVLEETKGTCEGRSRFPASLLGHSAWPEPPPPSTGSSHTSFKRSRSGFAELRAHEFPRTAEGIDQGLLSRSLFSAHAPNLDMWLGRQARCQKEKQRDGVPHANNKSDS